MRVPGREIGLDDGIGAIGGQGRLRRSAQGNGNGTGVTRKWRRSMILVLPG